MILQAEEFIRRFLLHEKSGPTKTDNARTKS
jgi:hypothetical protein